MRLFRPASLRIRRSNSWQNTNWVKAAPSALNSSRPHRIRKWGRASAFGDSGAVCPLFFRFLVILAILGGIAYGAMFALATFVEPNYGEMSVRVPLDQ